MKVVVDTPKSQSEATAFCQALNVRSTLARPQNQDEEVKINRLLREANGNYRYLAMNREEATGTWMWNKGTAVVTKCRWSHQYIYKRLGVPSQG